MMLPEDMRKWVGRDHFAWFLIDVVEHLDTAALLRLIERGPTPGLPRLRPGR